METKHETGKFKSWFRKFRFAIVYEELADRIS
jgi:hypothetical protein